MSQGFLLSRVQLDMGRAGTVRDAEDVITQLSAVTVDSAGNLWVGADEGRHLDRLSPLNGARFGEHRIFTAAKLLELPGDDEEIDIEALEIVGEDLWLSGSHSAKRKKPKGKKLEKNLKRLATVESEANRCLLARIPLVGGEPMAKAPDGRHAARLPAGEDESVLMGALAEDEHFGPFVKAGIPSKDNGLDVEGLVVHENRAFMGLRGPVLRGWACVLELPLDVGEADALHLHNDPPFYKHFLDLQGLGIRDLCRDGNDVLILAGPTMGLEGILRVYRWREPFANDGHSMQACDGKRLEALFDLPFVVSWDRAEGLTVTECLGYETGVMVVYDDPHPQRRVGETSILMDVFRLPGHGA